MPTKSNTTHGLGPTRTRVLALLQAATEPVSVITVAEELGLHKNSARFHLDALVDAGFAERAVSATGTQGRPPLVFTATSEAPTLGNLHLTELLEVLISSFIEPTEDARTLAELAGRRWGTSVASQEQPSGAALAELSVHLGERGFGTAHDDDTVTFTRCPFRSTISPSQLPLVCAMHRGFLDGYLETSKADLITDQLQVGPKVCHATFIGKPADQEKPGDDA